MALHWGQFCPLGDGRQYLEIFWVVHGVTKSRTQLSAFTSLFTIKSKLVLMINYTVMLAIMVGRFREKTLRASHPHQKVDQELYLRKYHICGRRLGGVGLEIQS